MKTREQKLDHIHATRNYRTDKRMFLSRGQINEALRERDILNRVNKEATHITFVAYGRPVGEYVAAMAMDTGITAEQADAELKRRKNEPKQGRISLKAWNNRVGVV